MNLYQEVNSPNHCFVVAGPNSGAVLFGSLNMETTENDAVVPCPLRVLSRLSTVTITIDTQLQLESEE